MPFGITSKKTTSIVYLLLALFLSGCFSYYPIEEPKLNDFVTRKNLSKIKLHDGTELNLSNGKNTLISIEPDSLTVRNIEGYVRKIALTDVDQWFEYKFNFTRTLIGTTVIVAAIYFIFMSAYLHFSPPP